MDTADSPSPPPQSDKKPQLNTAAATTVANIPASNSANAITTTASASASISAAAAAPLSVDQLDIEILPVIYEIIRSIEKDPTEIAAKQRESQDCSQKILELQRRLENARQQIRQLPGIAFNKEEQLQRLETLRNQLVLKQKLIKKYKHTQF